MWLTKAYLFTERAIWTPNIGHQHQPDIGHQETAVGEKALQMLLRRLLCRGRKVQFSMSRIVVWGCYDESKPRVRLLLEALRTQGVLAAEINIPIWSAIRDKAVAGRGKLLAAGLHLLASYPAALTRLFRQPAQSAILLGYPAIPDIFLAWPVARLRGHKIIFDAFLPLHDTVVGDRRLIRPYGLLSKVLHGIEWLALRLADIILVDTDQHGDFFAKEYGIPRERFQTVLVGAEPAFWAVRDGGSIRPSHPATAGGKPLVLFYGQLIPLHGLDTILAAINHTAAEPFHWLLIGSGQEEPMLRQFLSEYGGDNVSWIQWVDYDELPAFIAAASVALGIFGTSDKAGRVIPNKVFQVLAAGKPIITRASDAVDPIIERYPQSVISVPAGDAEALAKAVPRMLKDGHRWRPVVREAEAYLGPTSGVEVLIARLALD